MGENNLPSLQIVFEQTEKALDRQFEQVSSLDTKLSILLGAGGIIFAALLGIIFGPLANVGVAQKFLFGVGTLFVLLSLAYAVSGYRLYRFERPPDARVLRTDYITRDEQETKLSIIDTCLGSLDRNSRVIARR